jgi:hypothetical protein
MTTPASASGVDHPCRLSERRAGRPHRPGGVRGDRRYGDAGARPAARGRVDRRQPPAVTTSASPPTRRDATVNRSCVGLSRSSALPQCARRTCCERGSCACGWGRRSRHRQHLERGMIRRDRAQLLVAGVGPDTTKEHPDLRSTASDTHATPAASPHRSAHAPQTPRHAYPPATPRYPPPAGYAPTGHGRGAKQDSGGHRAQADSPASSATHRWHVP